MGREGSVKLDLSGEQLSWEQGWEVGRVYKRLELIYFGEQNLVRRKNEVAKDAANHRQNGRV